MREEDGGAQQSRHLTSLLMTKNVDCIIDQNKSFKYFSWQK